MRYDHIIAAVFNTPWAIRREVLRQIASLIEFKSQGGELSREEIMARVGDNEGRQDPDSYTVPIAAEVNAASGGGSRGGLIAVLPVYGVISQRMNLMSDMSGGTSTENFAKRFRAAVNDPSVRSIVLDVDSPGGGVYGVEELATEIFNARSQKKIVAVANSLAASAAYWIASAASEFVVTPSGEVGSIGVYAEHADFSKNLEAKGVKVTLISAGKFKTEGNDTEPLTDAARESIQAQVDNYYQMFVKAVARNRGVTPSDVRGGFGEGRVVSASEAKSLGMVDRVATLQETIERLGARSGASATAAATTFSIPITSVTGEMQTVTHVSTADITNTFEVWHRVDEQKAKSKARRRQELAVEEAI